MRSIKQVETDQERLGDADFKFREACFDFERTLNIFNKKYKVWPRDIDSHSSADLIKSGDELYEKMEDKIDDLKKTPAEPTLI